MACRRVVPAVNCMAVRCLSESSTVRPPRAQNNSAPVDPLAKVTGLSQNVVLKPGPVAADAAYKVPEYFLYGRHSYAEAEIELAPFRCPQPNANRK